MVHADRRRRQQLPKMIMRYSTHKATARQLSVSAESANAEIILHMPAAIGACLSLITHRYPGTTRRL